VRTSSDTGNATSDTGNAVSDTGNAASDTANAASDTRNATSDTGNAAPEIATRRSDFGAGSSESSFPNYKHSLTGTDTSARRSMQLVTASD